MYRAITLNTFEIYSKVESSESELPAREERSIRDRLFREATFRDLERESKEKRKQTQRSRLPWKNPYFRITVLRFTRAAARGLSNDSR
jgi:hypothetical protein